MGLRQEVNQVYLLHRLALEKWRARASLYPGLALQGPQKRLRSEATTPLRYFALFTLPKQAENSLRSSMLEQRLRTLLLGVRLKSDEGKSKQEDPVDRTGATESRSPGFLFRLSYLLTAMLLNFFFLFFIYKVDIKKV